MANTIIKVPVLQAEVIRLLDKKAVILPWANRKYEGEIKKQGDTVTVQVFPNLAFTVGGNAGDDITGQDITITAENLTVDQVAQLRVAIKDIEATQSNLSLEQQVADRIAYAQANLFDQFIGAFVDSAVSTVAIGAPDKATIYSKVVGARVKLSELNAFEDAALFVPPAIAGIIRQAPEFDGFREGHDSRIKGFVGKLDGFTVIESNNLPAGKLLAMDKSSVHFVAQLTQVKSTDAELGFRTNVLAELVYGGKVFSENAKRMVKLTYT